MGMRVLDRGDVIKGSPVVQPSDDLFWFGRPRFLLFLIHFVLFLNAFQIAFLAWSYYEFGYPSCYHENIEDMIIRLSMGALVQFLCSYVTLPLYALVNQMGSKMRPVIFSNNVATALRGWHQTAKKHVKQGRASGSSTPFSSRPASPLHGSTSPLYLLQGYNKSNYEEGPDDDGHDFKYGEDPLSQNSIVEVEIERDVENPPSPSVGSRATYHNDFSFRNKDTET